MRRPGRWPLGIAAGALAVAAAAALVTVTTGSGDSHGQPPKAVSTLDAQPRACLLTGAAADPATANRAWAGVRQVAAHKKELTAQRYTLPAGITPSTYLGTLTQLRCTVIITVGDDLRPATTAGGRPRYVMVSDRPSATPGATSLTPATATASTVADAVRNAIEL